MKHFLVILTLLTLACRPTEETTATDTTMTSGTETTATTETTTETTATTETAPTTGTAPIVERVQETTQRVAREVKEETREIAQATGTALERAGEAIQEKVAETAPASSASGNAQEGAAVFKSKCAACHGANGKGDTAMGKKLKISDLSSSAVQSQSDAQLENVIRNGKGPQSEKAHKSKALTAEQLRDVIAFIRSL